ncbi:hypothetical protein IW146_001066 [Coemansia sp. RSA 922]|nr:hypothetical protein IW146_001066 [Coemansia sp. RSA 922]KAJ2354231.1 hypothetical protein GGH92_000167 [Coemansia sp. RSA 2673]
MYGIGLPVVASFRSPGLSRALRASTTPVSILHRSLSKRPFNLPGTVLGNQRRYAQGRYSRYDQQQYEQQHQDSRYEEESQWEYRPEGPSGGRVLLFRPIVWTAIFTTGVYYLCTESFIKHREQLRQSSHYYFGRLGNFYGGSTDDSQIADLMRDPRVQRLVGWSHAVTGLSHARALSRVARLPDWIPLELKRTVAAFTDRWHTLSRGQRCVYTIAALNAVVLGMWQIPRLLPFMARTFLHDPRTGRSYTLLTSSFSHREVWHFAFNTIGLVSFGSIVADTMSTEQFTAFYLSAGVISGLASHLLSPLRAALIMPSLGASGAVYAVVGASMMLNPDSKIALIFLPFVPISISHAFPALLAYDFLGAILGWQKFGHVAHLTGGLLGIAYVQWGMDQWAQLVRAIEVHRAKRSKQNSIGR